MMIDLITKIEGMLKKWLWQRKKKKVCKINNYNCPECIYHDFLYSGISFKGVVCNFYQNLY